MREERGTERRGDRKILREGDREKGTKREGDREREGRQRGRVGRQRGGGREGK